MTDNNQWPPSMKMPATRPTVSVGDGSGREQGTPSTTWQWLSAFVPRYEILEAIHRGGVEVAFWARSKSRGVEVKLVLFPQSCADLVAALKQIRAPYVVDRLGSSRPTIRSAANYPVRDLEPLAGGKRSATTGTRSAALTTSR